jgi:aminomethyltransferase
VVRKVGIVITATCGYIFTAMTKQSLLIELHQKNGAVFDEKDHWLLPTHFGDPTAEYESVRGAAGLFDLSHRALLQFTGPDRVSFLQGMLSNDLRGLKMFEGQRATLLTQQGKVIADVRVLCAMNSIYLDFWEPLKEKILTHLNRYLVADEVEINDPSGDWKTLSLQGPQAEILLGRLFDPVKLPAQADHHAMVEFNAAPVCVVRADRSGENGFDLIVQNSLLLAFAQGLTELGASWVGEQAQNVLRIEAGIPRYGIDFTEDHLLLEVGLDHAVSFTKGCYLGQEVVERIRSRGHVNKKLCGLLLEGNTPANPGDKAFAGDKEVGNITSSVASPALNRPIALAYVNKDHWSVGTHLEVRGKSTSIAATVTTLPFVAPAPISS